MWLLALPGACSRPSEFIRVRKLAPLLFVLLAASLWSWVRQSAPPEVLPTRANCSVHGVHLGATEAEVIQVVGQPDQTAPYSSAGREQSFVWTWGHPKPPDLPTLTVTFDQQRVSSVLGTSLKVGCKDYGLNAGDPPGAADYLGTPTSSTSLFYNSDTRSDFYTTWKFSELSVVMYSSHDCINTLGIHNYRRP